MVSQEEEKWIFLEMFESIKEYNLLHEISYFAECSVQPMERKRYRVEEDWFTDLDILNRHKTSIEGPLDVLCPLVAKTPFT